MREAIITIIDTETTDGETYSTSQVFRVEFEGDAGITGEVNNTDTFELKNVVNCEQMVGHQEAPGVTGR